MVPEGLGFETVQLLGAHVEARQVAQFQLIPLHGVAQLLLVLPPVAGQVAHGFHVHAPGVAARGLGRIQGDIGVAQQFIGPFVTGLRPGDTDAHPQVQRIAVQVHGPLHAVDQPFTELIEIVGVAGIGHDDDKLIPPAAPPDRCHARFAGEYAPLP